MTVRIGIDQGGTKIEGIVLADSDGRTLARRRVATPRDDYDATLRCVADLVAGLERDVGARGTVGVGIPGTISRHTGQVKNANSTWLNGRPLDRDLARVLDRPVRLANDADCFALSEATDGAGRDAASVFGVILGTGVGAGVVVNGRILEGPNGTAGEWGHMPLPWMTGDERPGRRCYCGRDGCVETFLSGPGIAADHLLHTGRALSGTEISYGATLGDADCAATLTRHTDRLARALAVVIGIIDPEVVVLGGGVGAMPHLTEALPRLLPGRVFGGECTTRILRPRFGDSSGVRGAAWLWGKGER